MRMIEEWEWESRVWIRVRWTNKIRVGHPQSRLGLMIKLDWREGCSEMGRGERGIGIGIGIGK